MGMVAWGLNIQELRRCVLPQSGGKGRGGQRMARFYCRGVSTPSRRWNCLLCGLKILSSLFSIPEPLCRVRQPSAGHVRQRCSSSSPVVSGQWSARGGTATITTLSRIILTDRCLCQRLQTGVSPTPPFQVRIQVRRMAAFWIVCSKNSRSEDPPINMPTTVRFPRLTTSFSVGYLSTIHLSSLTCLSTNVLPFEHFSGS